MIRDVAILFIHLIITIARLFGPGGARSVISESLLVKHQLLILSRSRVRAPHLRSSDRVIIGLRAILMRPSRLLRSAIALKPFTILGFHQALVQRKYRLLFTPNTRGKPGPSGPSPELISAIVEMKRRNPIFACQRIADQISLVFDIEIDKDVVRRVLARHYRPEPGSNGPSWLTFLGHSKDSLWSVNLFRCESLILKSHWVMVVMDQFTRRNIGFAVHAEILDGPTVCRMFNSIIGGSKSPRYLSSDNDPLFRFHQWNANLRILEVTEVKTVPYVPFSHPFVERRIGMIPREFLDRASFWSSRDLGRKLLLFEEYYNRERVHRGVGCELQFKPLVVGDTNCDSVPSSDSRLSERPYDPFYGLVHRVVRRRALGEHDLYCNIFCTAVISSPDHEQSRKILDRGTLVVLCRSVFRQKDGRKERKARFSPPSLRESEDWRSIGEIGIVDRCRNSSIGEVRTH